MELEDRRRELDTAPGPRCFGRRPKWACCRCISQVASRRRGATLSRCPGRQWGGALHQPDHLGGRAGSRTSGSAADGGAGARAGVDPGRRSGTVRRIADYSGAYARKVALAGDVVALGMPLTLNVVVHRGNIERLADMVKLAASLGARRIEIAHVQYYGWALHNRTALMPTRAQAEAAIGQIETLRERHRGAAHDRLGCAGLLRKATEALHGRLGQSFLERDAGRDLYCRAMRRKRSPGSNSGPCRITAWRRSGNAPRRSTRSVAWPG